MKYFKFIFVVFLILTLDKANAYDYIATQTFTTLANDTIEIETSGNTSATINGMTGTLSNDLHVNFQITSNVAIGDLRVRALVDTYTSGAVGAFKSSATLSGSSLPVTLVLGNTSPSYLPCHSCVKDAQGIPTPCAETGLYTNANAIAYTGTINADNSGVLTYVNDANESYFTAKIGTNVTNLNLNLGTNHKAGTYDINEAWDILGSYQAVVYLDNIPD
jgi:hypothetical protein